MERGEVTETTCKEKTDWKGRRSSKESERREKGRTRKIRYR